jgi:hypothetical protein
MPVFRSVFMSALVPITLPSLGRQTVDKISKIVAAVNPIGNSTQPYFSERVK